MVRPRKANKGSLKIVPLNLDYDDFLEFEESLPHNLSVSEMVREFIKSQNEERKIQKNVSSPNYSPIKQGNNIIDNTLDKYFPSHIIEWESFKAIVELLPEQERTKLTEIWKHDYRILEATNKNMTGSYVYPFAKGDITK